MTFVIPNLVKQPRQKTTTTMPFEGQNEVTLAQALSPKQATLIENYFIDKQFRLVRRKGSKKLAQVSANTNPIKELGQLTDTLVIIGYATTLAMFNINDNTINTIKSDFSANLTDGLRWGNDFYSCNGRLGDKIYKTTLPTLDYDEQTVNFVVGSTITGGTSGATATIVSDTDGGATGTLEIDNINGVFQNNEALSGSGSGAAKVDGTVDYTNTAEISAGSGTVPKCEKLNIFDLALCAISTDSGESWMQASKKNDFTKWEEGANAGDPYSVKFERAGAATDMGNLQNTAAGSESFGDIGVIFYKNGKYAYYNEVIDSGGTLTQKQTEFFQRLDDGGERGILSTPLGIFYGNENGEFLLRRDGSKINLTDSFDDKTIIDLNANDSDRVYLPEKEILLVTLKSKSASNNIVYWFDTKTIGKRKITWGKITGWAINRFLLIGRTLYGGSSTSPKIVELLPDNIYDDEEVDVYYKYNQPLNFGQQETVKNLLEIYIDGEITGGSPVDVEIFGLDEFGNETTTNKRFQWSKEAGGAGGSAYGKAQYAKNAFVRNPFSGLSRNPQVAYPKAYGYKQYEIRISGNDKSSHILSIISITGNETRRQRQNLLTNIT